jgi:hypothetical protein
MVRRSAVGTVGLEFRYSTNVWPGSLKLASQSVGPGSGKGVKNRLTVSIANRSCRGPVFVILAFEVFDVFSAVGVPHDAKRKTITNGKSNKRTPSSTSKLF